jgi:hypothetical protein
MKNLFKTKKPNTVTPAVIYVEKFEMADLYKERNKFYAKQFTRVSVLIITTGIVAGAVLSKLQNKDL